MAKEYNCPITFAQKAGAKQHARRSHRQFPCPMAERSDCMRTFPSKGSATSHAKDFYGTLSKFPCPVAKKYQCAKVFVWLEDATRHARVGHKGNNKKPKRFIVPGSGEEHGQSHLPKSRLSEEEESSPAQSQVPKPRLCTKGKIHRTRFAGICPYAKQYTRRKDYLCKTIFSTRRDYNHHLQVHIGPWKVCTVPMCRYAVVETPLYPRRMSAHLNSHIKKGNAELVRKYPPRPADANKMQLAETLYKKMLEVFSGELQVAEEILKEGEIREEKEEDILGDTEILVSPLPADQIFSRSHRNMIKEFNKSSRGLNLL